jgi:hypothetical protein
VLDMRPWVKDATVALNELERALSEVPDPLFVEQRRKGPAPRAWYSDFVRYCAKIAQGCGVDVTTQGDRTNDPHATPFTRFVFGVERLLPREDQSASLAACARRIDRVIAASADKIGARIQRKRKRRKLA